MSFITFIYTIGKNNKKYYGKYCFDYMSDDHGGLDMEVKNILTKGLNEYRTKNNMKKLKSKINLGILSFSSNDVIPTFSTHNEIKCFDFYCSYDNIYVNGRLV